MWFKDRCYDYQCLNGGQCVENNGLPECRCARQYVGCNCEQNGQFVGRKILPKHMFAPKINHRSCQFESCIEQKWVVGLNWLLWSGGLSR